jgi:hypothetical protein
VEPTAEFARLRLGFVDQTQRRNEVIRLLYPQSYSTDVSDSIKIALAPPSNTRVIRGKQEVKAPEDLRHDGMRPASISASEAPGTPEEPLGCRGASLLVALMTGNDPLACRVRLISGAAWRRDKGRSKLM